MKNLLTRSTALILLLLFALLGTSCSFTNNYVVVNASNQPLRVWYRFKKPTDPAMPRGLRNIAPQTKEFSQIDEQIAWQPLPASRYTIDSDNSVMKLTLNPGEALLLTQCRPAGGSSSGDCTSDTFSIDEIILVGANGQIILRGEQAHKSFVLRSKSTYTLTYY